MLWVYLTTMLGVFFHLHYCGGQLESVSLFKANDEASCCGGEMKSGGCCKDQTVYIKLNADQKSTIDITVPSISSKSVLSLTYFVIQLFTLTNEIKEIAPKYYSPPLVFEHSPLYILHSILII